MIEKKVQQLSDEDQQLMEATSVQGFEFDSAIVFKVLDLEIDEERCHCEGRPPRDSVDGLGGVVARRCVPAQLLRKLINQGNTKADWPVPHFLQLSLLVLPKGWILFNQLG